jgi:phage terminase large subunit
MGLSAFYEVQATVIKGLNGTEITFAGLSDQTAESVKSYEGVDIVWCEEAQAITERSWKILIPTIRKDGSEVWITFNPELDTDPTYVRFVENAPEDSFVVKMNYSDNPWFNGILEAERLRDKEMLPKAEYDHTWEGICLPAVSGAIYADEIASAKEATPSRICDVPYDPAMKVHVVFDLGWNDQMTLILVQKHLSQLRVIEYIEGNHKTLDWYSTELKTRKHNWGTIWLPHDGENRDFKTGKSSQEIMQELGWKVSIVPKLGIEEGIRLARRQFGQVYFDKTKAGPLVECLKRYRRALPMSTGEPGAPLHDQFSHGADAFRYLHVVAPKLSNEDWGGKLTYKTLATA